MHYTDPVFAATLQKLLEFLGTFAFAISDMQLLSTLTGLADLCVVWL